MTLVYPFEGRLPILWASVQCQLTERRFAARFLVDTGSCYTCLPSSFASAYGHQNDHPDIEKLEVNAMGGQTAGYVHRFRFGLLDPNYRQKPVLNRALWESASDKIYFMEGLEAFGLIGMDVISQWTELKLNWRNPRNGGFLHVSIK